MRSLGALTPAALAIFLFACGDTSTPADGGADHAGHLPADLAVAAADLPFPLDLAPASDLATAADLAALFCANCHAAQANAVVAGKHK